MNDPPAARPDLAPPDFYDPVIEAYKKDVDRTLLRENLKLTVEERIRKAQERYEREGWMVRCLTQLDQAKHAITELQALLEERRKLEGAG